MQIPSSLVKSLVGLKGFNQESFLKVHASGEKLTSIRLNPGKKQFNFIVNSFAESGSQTPSDRIIRAGTNLKSQTQSPVPWSSQGYYLNERPSFTFDPLFHAGCYYVQEASSMFLEQAFQQTVDASANIRVLDLCAAPGGKSTLLQSLISSGSLLVSNEVIKSRVTILEENITKWGGANVIVTNNDPADFARLQNFFDVLVVDAPCSGSGLFRRDPTAIEEWSEQNVQLCSQRQQRIIADVWPALKQNGILIYSTCSYSKEEDEDLLDWIADNLPVSSCPLQINPEWGIVETRSAKHSAYGYRFWPDSVQGEGFFIACFRKSDGGDYSQRNSKKIKTETLSKSDEAIVSPWLQQKALFELIRQGDSILALPVGMRIDLQSIMSVSLYIKQAGIRIGKIAGKDFVPDHALAMSNWVSDQLVAVSLNREEAIQYLRREEVQIEKKDKSNGGIEIVKLGWALVQYQGITLGWIKIVKNRVNNYYPKEWRIMKR